MGAPVLDFSKSRRASGDERAATFAPMKGGNAAKTLLWAGLGVAILLVAWLLIRMVRRNLAQTGGREEATERWRKVRAFAAQKGLDAREVEGLIATLVEVRAVHPEQAVAQAGYFRAMVLPELKRRLGDHASGRVVRKLFQGGAPEESGTGTHTLAAGQRMRIHFSGMNGTYACTVLSIGEGGVVVSLPAAGAHHLRPRTGTPVEIYCEQKGGQAVYASRVEEVFQGGVFACRLAHAANAETLRMRDAARIPSPRPVVFAHFAGAEVAGGQINLASLQERLTGRWEGLLKNLSLAGATIVSPGGRNFEVGDFVRFVLQLLPDEGGIELLGTIAHIAPVPAHEGGGRVLHIQFLALDDDAAGSLTRTVYQTRQEGGGSEG